MGKMKLTIAVIGLLRLNFTEAGTKKWQKSISLGNPEMWKSGRLPCSNQKIILPENEVIFMPHSFSVGSDLVFPQNGMILFPTSGK